MFSSWFYVSSCVSILVTLCVSSTYSSVYSDHCSSLIPESRPTVRTYITTILPSVTTTYLTGGDGIAGKKRSNYSYDNNFQDGKSLTFPISPILFRTTAEGIYKVEAELYLVGYYTIGGGNNSFSGSYYNRDGPGKLNSIPFNLSGFWSALSGKLCMVGTGYSLGVNGEVLYYGVTFKLNFVSGDRLDMFNSIITGTLESIDNPPYFEPVSLFSFPVIPTYDYSLVSPELGFGTNGLEVEKKNDSLNLESSSFCSIVAFGNSGIELEYATECNRSVQGCSPLSGSDGFLAPRVSMYPIQCSLDERKVRCLVTFKKSKFDLGNQDFDVNSTWLAEGAWDDKSNQILVVACRLLDSAHFSGNPLGDCALRLSLRYPSVWSIRHTKRIVGKIWTQKNVNDAGYFREIKVTVNDVYDMIALPHIRYEYTVLD